MKELFYCIYIAWFGDIYRVFMTHNPAVDLAASYKGVRPDRLDILSPYLPIGVCGYILKAVFTPEETNGCKFPQSRAGRVSRLLQFFGQYPDPGALVNSKCRRIAALLKKITFPSECGLINPADAVYPVKAYPQKDVSEYQIDTGVIKALEGRILFLEEMEQSLRENRGSWGSEDNGSERDERFSGLLDVLQYLALNGYVNILPSLGFIAPGIIRCTRCGWEVVLRQERDFPYRCEQCSQLGEARLTRGLFALQRNGKPRSEERPCSVELQGVPPLTPAQSRASEQLRELVKNKDLKECLLWAVTGAGKTEVVLDVIAETVRKGGRVLYATPRRDVVMEIAPRLEKSLPGISINALYGGSKEKYTSADLVAATTHQVIRYFRAFDLVVLDEVDAYPYRDNKMLETGVLQAVNQHGKIIYLTATPGPSLLGKVRRGRALLITIPARHHGHPVPEPVFLQKKAFIQERGGQTGVEPFVLQLLRDWLREGSQVFVFLPTVRMVESYGSVLREIILKEAADRDIISCSHSRDPLRDAKRESFKQGLTRIFVTTSIMERGITVKKANVLVLEAGCEQIFDEGSLIQMAGRAGRSTQYPGGQVVFVSREITSAMKGARNKIRYMNELARKNGFLKPGL